MATMLQKFSPFISLARWILCNEHLVRYLHPTDEELKGLIGKNSAVTSKGKGKRAAPTDARKRQSNAAAVGSNGEGVKTFTVPCNIDVQLDKATVY